MTRPNSSLSPSARRPLRRGFTLVELLVVIAVIGILIGLLMPVVMNALKTGNEAAVTADINLLANALAAFKDQYGDYPPSRVLLSESGAYNTTSTAAVPSNNPIADLTQGQLAQRSLRHLRKFWPRASSARRARRSARTSTPARGRSTTSTATGTSTATATRVHYLEGHECLVFFLGGIPSTSGEGMSGFAKNPANPFINDHPTYGTSNRTTPLFEFNGGRLYDDDRNGIPATSTRWARTPTRGTSPTSARMDQ